MDLIILAGGFGTRLKSISEGTPKALMKVGKYLYLDILLERVLNFSIKNIFLSLHYKPELFIKYISKSKYKNIIIPAIEPEPLGTGGAINYIIKNFNVSSPFLVINGDTLSDLNVDKMIEDFNRNNFLAMVGISKVKNTQRYGRVIEKNGKVLSFQEKIISRKNGWINNGHYIFEKTIFNDYYGSFPIEKNVFPALIKNNKLGTFKVFNDNFIDLGIPKDYFELVKNNIDR